MLTATERPVFEWMLIVADCRTHACRNAHNVPATSRAVPCGYGPLNYSTTAADM